MIKNTAGQSIGSQMVNATTGAAFVGTVTVYVTIDSGTQALGTVGSGVCTAEGNGYYTYLPSQAETNGNLIAFTFIGTGAIPATIQVATVTAAQASALVVVTGTGAATQTYRDLIANALQDLQVIAGGETLADDDAALGLSRLNDWIDALALEGLIIPTITRQTWTLVSGTASYTVGTGSTVSIPKPVSPQAIENVGYYDTSLTTVTEILFGRVLSNQEYDAVPQKALQQTYPTAFWYDPTFGTTGTISPLPIPNISTLKGVIYAPGSLSEVLLTDTVALPKGYRRFFRSNLTEELAAAFEKPVPASIAKIARLSRERVKAANFRMVDMSFDVGTPGLSRLGIYDILTDT